MIKSLTVTQNPKSETLISGSGVKRGAEGLAPTNYRIAGFYCEKNYKLINLAPIRNVCDY